MSALEKTNIFDPNWVTKYSEIKSQFKTGDIILVHGRYPFSWLIELLQGSQWGHSAMVVLAKDLDPENKKGYPEVMIWESNVKIEGSAKNLWLKEGQVPYYKEGPMLISLEERLIHTQRNYKNVRIAYRPVHLEKPIPNEALPQLFNRVIDKKFPGDREIISSIFLGRTQNRVSNEPDQSVDLDINFSTGEVKVISFNANKLKDTLSAVDIDKDKIYCSELLAMTYKTLGLLTQNHVSNSYAPKDFSKEGSTRLLNRAWLDAEIFINMIL